MPFCRLHLRGMHSGCGECMRQSPFGQSMESWLAGGALWRSRVIAGWDGIDRIDLVASRLRCGDFTSRHFGSLGQDELSPSGMAQLVDTAVVLDLHHGAGFEQLGAGNPSDTCPRCVIGRGERRRAVAVRELRVGTSIGWSVHDRDVEVGTPACEPAQSSCARSENCSSIVVSTRCAETGRRASSIISITNANHSYSINTRCQPRFRA